MVHEPLVLDVNDVVGEVRWRLGREIETCLDPALAPVRIDAAILLEVLLAARGRIETRAANGEVAIAVPGAALDAGAIACAGGRVEGDVIYLAAVDAPLELVGDLAAVLPRRPLDDLSARRRR